MYLRFQILSPCTTANGNEQCQSDATTYKQFIEGIFNVIQQFLENK